MLKGENGAFLTYLAAQSIKLLDFGQHLPKKCDCCQNWKWEKIIIIMIWRFLLARLRFAAAGLKSLERLNGEKRERALTKFNKFPIFYIIFLFWKLKAAINYIRIKNQFIIYKETTICKELAKDLWSSRCIKIECLTSSYMSENHLRKKAEFELVSDLGH